jgi:replication factor A1
MADIATLRANSNATIEATITAISPVRDVDTSRGRSRVADATLTDTTGTVTFTLWGDEADRYRVGQRLKIVDGWVKEYRGRLQLSLGRSGTVEIMPG